MTRSSLFVALLLLASALVVHAADSPTKEVDTTWINAMKANDVDAVMKCYAPDAIAALPGAPLARGDKAIRATYEGLLSANTVTDVSISETGHRQARNVATGWGTFSLTPLTPRPRINLIFYHGVLAPNARLRAAVVVYGAPPAVDPLPAAGVSPAADVPGESGAAGRSTRRGWGWAQLMRRAFGIDVLACRRCGGRLRLIATILDPRTIRAMLVSLGLPTEGTDRSPPAAQRG